MRCFVFFCFNRADDIIFSRAYVLHETFQNSSRSSQRSLGGVFGGREGRLRKFLCCPRTVQQLCGEKKKKKKSEESSFITQQKHPLVEMGAPFKGRPENTKKGSPQFPNLLGAILRW